MTDHDFKLDGEFGDAQQLRASWMKSAIPVHVAEFLSKVLNIDKISFVYHDDNNLVKESPICRDNDDHTMQRQTTPVLGCRSRVMSLFQILFDSVQMINKKTPMRLVTAHCIHEKYESRKLITCANRMGLCVSYNEVMESRRNLHSIQVRHDRQFFLFQVTL